MTSQASLVNQHLQEDGSRRVNPTMYPGRPSAQPLLARSTTWGRAAENLDVPRASSGMRPSHLAHASRSNVAGWSTSWTSVPYREPQWLPYEQKGLYWVRRGIAVLAKLAKRECDWHSAHANSMDPCWRMTRATSCVATFSWLKKRSFVTGQVCGNLKGRSSTWNS